LLPRIGAPSGGYCTILSLGRAFADHHQVRDPAGVLGSLAGAALGPVGAQASGQLSAWLPVARHEHRQHVDHEFLLGDRLGEPEGAAAVGSWLRS
jgi:hypothetical protein